MSDDRKPAPQPSQPDLSPKTVRRPPNKMIGPGGTKGGYVTK